MKDAKEILTSKSVLEGHFSIDIGEENIYEWTVSIVSFFSRKFFSQLFFQLKVDEDSDLAKDMKKHKTHIKLSLEFTPDYPFSPPKVQLIFFDS